MRYFLASRTAKSPALALLLLSGLAGVMTAGLASAATPSEDVPSVVVKYDRQSLGTDDGVSNLYRRITTAAARVCVNPDIRNLAAREHVEQCRSHAVAAAIRQIDNAKLAALYASNAKNS